MYPMTQKIEFIQNGTNFELKMECRLGAAPSALDMVRSAVQALAERYDPEGLADLEAEEPESLEQSALLP